MSQRKLPVELIGKIVSQVKEKPSLARTMGKYLSKQEKEQLTNYTNKNGALKNCNTSEVKNLSLLGIEFTKEDLIVAASSHCTNTVKFLQEKYPKCLITTDLLSENYNINTKKFLLKNIKEKNFSKINFLNLIMTQLKSMIFQENFNKDLAFLTAIIKINPYKYKFNLRDILLFRPLLIYINNRNTDIIRINYIFDIVICLSFVYKISKADIEWLFTRYITSTTISPVMRGKFTINPGDFLILLKKTLKTFEMNNLYNEIVKENNIIDLTKKRS